MSDVDLRLRIVDELDFDPSVEAAGIGVAAKDGVVTLTGHVSSYAEKVSVERAVRRVKGVRAIAQEIEIRYPREKKMADNEIAARALKIIAWDTTVPEEAVQVKVEAGWITLTGEVPWQFQKDAAERAVRKLSGVAGVSNRITVKPAVPPVRPDLLTARIEAALDRNAEVDRSRIKIHAADAKVELDGHVRSWREHSAASWAAWSVPGVREVENRLSVG